MDAVVDADINHVVRQVSEISSLRRDDANEYVLGGLGGCRLPVNWRLRGLSPVRSLGQKIVRAKSVAVRPTQNRAQLV